MEIQKNVGMVQKLGECRHEGQEWYENLKKHFLEWKKKNPNR